MSLNHTICVYDAIFNAHLLLLMSRSVLWGLTTSWVTLITRFWIKYDIIPHRALHIFTQALLWLPLVPVTIIMFNTQNVKLLYIWRWFSPGAVGSCSVAPGTCLCISGLKLNPLQGRRSAITQTGGMPGRSCLTKQYLRWGLPETGFFFFSWRWCNGLKHTACCNRKRHIV